jgi:hypothetical protein
MFTAVDRPVLQWGDSWIAAHPIRTIAIFLIASFLAASWLLGGIGRSWAFVVFFGVLPSVLAVWNARARVRQQGESPPQRRAP